MHFCTHVTIVRQFGREMAQIQPPTHTLDPKPIYFCAEVFHILLLTAQNRSKWKNLQVRFRDEIWPGMVGLTFSSYHHLNNSTQLPQLKIGHSPQRACVHPVPFHFAPL